jgi:hypothetical protein
MNKKLLALVGVIALGIGGASVIALQSHAQNASSQPATTSVVTTPAAPENTATDTDNIQNDKGGVETPDAVTSTVKQADTQEHAEGTTADVNEVEDGN